MNTSSNRPHRGGQNGAPRSFSRSGNSKNAKRRKPNTSRYNRGGGGRGRNTRKFSTFDPSKFINTNPVERAPEAYEAKHNFSDFGLSQKLAQTISKLGMETPSAIQDQIIPHILKNKDVTGLAETGAGKTAAFLIPLIEKTLESPNRQTLILTPTRELAIQIQEELKSLSEGNHISSVIGVGGTNIRPQIKGLQKKNHFVIGTPGRILDLISRKSFHPERMNTVVLDEADRMLDMGFIHDIKKILSTTPKSRETLLFSATMPTAAKNIVDDFLREPVHVSVKKKDVTSSIKQDVVPYTQANKFETLTELLHKPELERIIVFGNMKHRVQKLANQLSENGIKSEAIHGNKSHVQRQRALKAFKSGHARVLAATDVAARGIHVDNVSHVINYDLPSTFEDYVHRIGRTGRVDKNGMALTFVPEQG